LRLLDATLVDPWEENAVHPILVAAVKAAGPVAAAAGGTGPFNVSGISTVLGSFLGIGMIVLGGVSVFRGVGQQAHRHVMGSALVGLVGLAIAGISFAGLTSSLATSLATMLVHK